jgi:hypothetical protein
MSAAAELSFAGGTAATLPRLPALLQALARIIRRQLFAPEDEIGAAIVRAFAEFARETTT